MHISEGILSGGMLAVGWAGTFAGVSYGLKHTSPEKIVKTALLSSTFFLASLVNVKIGPSSTHLTLLAPMGLLLGRGVFPAVFTALLLQALLFGFGGLLVLGANTLTMGLSSFLTYVIFSGLIKKKGAFFSFIAGAFAVMLCALLTGAMLGLTDRNFIGAVKLLIMIHVPLSLIEGLATFFLAAWLKRAAPELLDV